MKFTMKNAKNKQQHKVNISSPVSSMVKDLAKSIKHLLAPKDWCFTPDLWPDMSDFCLALTLMLCQTYVTADLTCLLLVT